MVGPYKNAYGARGIKRKYRKSDTGSRKTEAPKSMSMFRSLGRPMGIPKKLCVTLRYYQAVTLADPITGAASTNLFRANSLYDPDFSGAGHQPMGYDQYIEMYSDILVKKSRITVTHLNSVTSGTVFGVTLSPSSSSLTIPGDYIEQQSCAYAYTNASLTTLNQSVVASFDAKRFFDVKDPSDDPDLHHGAGTNPASVAFFHVFVGGFTSTADAAASAVNVLIEYDVEFSEPIQLNAS